MGLGRVRGYVFAGNWERCEAKSDLHRTNMDASNPLSDVDRHIRAANDESIGSSLHALEPLFSYSSTLFERADGATPMEANDPVPQNGAAPLVRMRCMIQDMFNPEYFPTRFQVSQQDEIVTMSGLFREGVEGVDASTVTMGSEIAQRFVYNCVPVPSRTAWAKNYERAQQDSLRTETNVGRKREREGAEYGHDGSFSGTQYSVNDTDHRRERDTGGGSPLVSTVSDERTSEQVAMVFKLPRGSNVRPEKHSSCVIKIYSDHNLKVNEVVDVIGILHAPPPRDHGALNACEFSMENHVSPYHLMPTVHALAIRRVHPRHHPMLPEASDNDMRSYLRLPSSLPRHISTVLSDMNAVRSEALLFLQGALGTDEALAKLVLLTIVSRVHSRVHDMCLGSLSLNIHGCSVSLAHHICTTLTKILDRVAVLSLTESSLQRESLVPRKDYDTERLNTGPLQLADGTVLLIDECRLDIAFQRDHQAKQNLASLNDVVRSQLAQYDFVHYRCPFHVDYPAIVVSTMKSALDCQCCVEFSPDAGSVDPMLDEVALARLRTYIALVRRIPLGPNDISNEMRTQMEEDFVRMRSINDRISQRNLHSWITMARLSALTRGQEEVSLKCWKEVLNLKF